MGMGQQLHCWMHVHVHCTKGTSAAQLAVPRCERVVDMS